MHTDVSVFIQSLCKAGIPASLQANAIHNRKVDCYYRNNPDGSIRWVWPSGVHTPVFLRFYHVAGTRARLFSAVARLAAFVGCLRFMASGRFCWYTGNTVAPFIPLCGNSSWAWFAGTPGPDRKAVLFTQPNGTQPGTFCKIALTARAQENIAHEAQQLQLFQQLPFRNVLLPHASLPGSCCVVQDMGAQCRRTNRFSQLPAAATQEWLTTHIEQMPYGATAFSATITRNLNNLKADKRLPASLLHKLQLLKASLQGDALVPLTAAHGDFTPWNILYQEDKLVMIDWELSQLRMPFLFDLFHFIYQSNILMGNRGYRAIRAELDALQQSPEWQGFVKQGGCSFAMLEKYYLLYILSHYLQVYSMQQRWHTQVQWLLQTWNEALGWHLSREEEVPVRKLLLEELKDMLAGYRYAVLKWKYQGLDSLPDNADLDVCMQKEDGDALLRRLQRHPLVNKVYVQRKSFMRQAELQLADGSLLYLDIIHAFKYKWLEFMSAEQLLLRAQVNSQGIRVPAVEDDFTYTWLFYWLNKAGLPAHYCLHFEKYRREAGARILRVLQVTHLMPVTDFAEVFEYMPALQKELKWVLKARPGNTGLSSVLNRLYYVSDTLAGLFIRKGFVITFSGVDGAGKTTVIENTRTLITKQFRRRVVVLRHRPSILPVLSAIKHGRQKAEQLFAQTPPRQGNNNNRLSSLLRFGYYYADYVLGQWYIQWRYINRGYVVLYDRYYFDFINDSKRSNIQLPVSLLRMGYRLLLKPRLNFFLYADENCILSRKQELPAYVIRRLTCSYLHLFRALAAGSHKARYVSLENVVLADTLGTILRYIKTMQHEKMD